MELEMSFDSYLDSVSNEISIYDHSHKKTKKSSALIPKLSKM